MVIETVSESGPERSARPQRGYFDPPQPGRRDHLPLRGFRDALPARHGRNWRKLSDGEKSEFMREFKKHLSHTYGDNIDNYRNEKVSILSEREEKRGDVTVKSTIVRSGGGDNVMVDYRLRKRGADWRHHRRRHRGRQSGGELPLAVPGDHQQQGRRRAVEAAARKKPRTAGFVR